SRMGLSYWPRVPTVSNAMRQSPQPPPLWDPHGEAVEDGFPIASLLAFPSITGIGGEDGPSLSLLATSEELADESLRFRRTRQPQECLGFEGNRFRQRPRRTSGHHRQGFADRRAHWQWIAFSLPLLFAVDLDQARTGRGNGVAAAVERQPEA